MVKGYAAGGQEDRKNVRDGNSCNLDSDASRGTPDLSVQRELGLLPERHFGHSLNSLVVPCSDR